MSTFAAVVFVTLLAPWTNAFASDGWIYSGHPENAQATQRAACELVFVYSSFSSAYSFHSVVPVDSSQPNALQDCRWTFNGGTALTTRGRILPFSCPSPNVIQNGQCVPPQTQCPAAGTAAGTHNFTVGWSYSPTAGSSTIAPPSFPSGTVSIGGCLATVGSVQECYRSSQPSAQGLYRLSCDYDLTHTGESGAPSTSTPDPNAPEPAPNCPGTSGTVNGVPVCLESGTPTPPTFPTPPVVGNPIPGNPNAPGTSPDPSSFDPTTGAGSSSPPGSPGAGGGSGGAGGTTVPSAGGGGSGEGENTGPKECGTPGRPKCQIDETGTPDGTGTEITDEQVNQYVADRTEQMEKKQEGWDFGWTLDLPQGACQPWTVGARGLSMTFDWCPYLEQMRALLGWFYMMITAVAIYGSFRSAGVFNKG